MKKHQNEDAVRQEYLRVRDDRASLAAAMTNITMLFRDGHTNIEIPYTERSLCLNIPCEWTEQKGQEPVLILKDEWNGHKKGAIIREINGIPASELSRMLDYPYENYHLFSLMNSELQKLSACQRAENQTHMECQRNISRLIIKSVSEFQGVNF